MEHVTLCTSPITLKALSLVFRNVMLVQPCEDYVPGARNHKTQFGLPPDKLTFHFNCEASGSVPAECCSTPIFLEAAAAWER